MDIAAWLRGLGLAEYEQAFRDNAIDAEILSTLTADDLKDIGVTVVGHRRKLLNGIAELAGDAAPTASPEARERAAPQTEGERRQLTVMFVDLVGSTALSGRLDPEDMGEVIRSYQNAVAGEMARFEGHVAKFMGDGVLAYFGWPRAHEDEAERAIRAGLAITEAVGRLKSPGGKSLAARVGIATGLVVVGNLVGAEEARERAVVGETPNLAARLQALAEVGTVVIAESTRRLVGELFECADLGAHDLKGFARPIQAWCVVRESAAESRFEARHAADAAPMVGREQEIALLLDRWASAKGGEGQVVLLAGEAGIGKSRITQALLERLGVEPHTRLRYYGSPYHSNSALHPVIVQLERAAGFAADDGAATKLDKLEAVLGRASERVSAVAPLLAALLSLPTGERYPPLDLTPQAHKARTLHALVGQLETLAARQPVLMVFDDAHWIDPTTTELFEQVIERVQHLPVLLLITFRPEFTPPWAGHAHTTTLALNRLGRNQGAAIVARLTGGKALPAEVLDQILAKTDGVPLFVEELTKTVLESGLLADAGDHLDLTGPLASLAIPSTLHDSLMARLDRLAPVKEIAQIGAVIGREFSHELLAAVAPLPEDRLTSALDELVAAELIFRRGRPPNVSYIFKHALVQDAAQQSLLKSRRQQLHAQIAQALEERFPAIAETEPEVLARHLTEAGLAEAAVRYWQKAGERAAQRSANLEAMAHLTRGLELIGELPPDQDNLRLELDMRVALGVTLVTAKGWAARETAAAFARARELCALTGNTSHLTMVNWGEYTGHLLRGPLQVALQQTEETLRQARDGSDTTALLMANRSIGFTSVHLGRADSACAHLERALSLYDPDTHRQLAHRFGYDVRVAIAAYLTHPLLHLGYPERARARRDQALEDARNLAHAPSLAFALLHLGVFHQVQGDLPSNAGLVEELIALCAEQGFAAWRASGLVQRGYVSLLSGRTDAGLAEMQQGLRNWRAPGVTLLVPLHLIQLAKAFAVLGQPEVGLDRLSEALAVIEESGERWHEAEAYRLKGELLLLLPTSSAAEAEASFRKAVDVAQGQNAKWPGLRAATSLARLWRDQGKRAEANDLLAPVYGWFAESFDTPDLQDARALLDQLQ